MIDNDSIQDIYKSFEDDDTIGCSQLYDIGLVLERLIRAENNVAKYLASIETQNKLIGDLRTRIETLEQQ